MENIKLDSKDIRLAVIAAALIVGLGLVLATILATSAWKTVRGFDNALSVTGSTKERVTSDAAKWTMEITRRASETGLKEANKQMKDDLGAASTWLTGAGIAPEHIITTPVYTQESYEYNKVQGAPREYMLRATIIVQSDDVEQITKLAKSTDTLVGQGVFVNTVSLEYYYSKLAELRVKLLGAALKDARARATEIAGADNKRVGMLKSASSGVVQVLPVNSGEVSDYGSFDTMHIEKEIFVTVRASFVLE